MICVEANSKFIDTIRANISRSKFPDLQVAILNYAIYYDSPRVYMELSEDSTETRALKNKL